MFMPSIRRRVERLLPAIAAIAAISLATSSTDAADGLRWKFKEGETLHYRMVQDTQIRMKANGMDNKNSIAQTIDMTWVIDAVDDQGVASMTQTIDRMRMKILTAQGTIHVDSAGGKLPDALAPSLEPVFKTLVGAKFTLKMSPEGKITDVVVPKSAVEALEKTPELGSLLSADSLKEMTEQASIPLPGKVVEQGATWTDAKDLAGVKLEMVYTFVGPETVDGKTFDKVSTHADLKLDLPQTEGLKSEMEKGEMNGTLLFDTATGKVVSSTGKQDLIISISGMGESLRQEVQSLVEMKLIPPGEKEAPPATNVLPAAGPGTESRTAPKAAAPQAGAPKATAPKAIAPK